MSNQQLGLFDVNYANPANQSGFPDASGAKSEGGDLYDARYWESAYREIVEAPALLLQLQDELAQARRREAFWISVVVHLIVVLLLWNSQKLAGFMPRRAVVVAEPRVEPEGPHLSRTASG